jgi:hypothetical protein
VHQLVVNASTIDNPRWVLQTNIGKGFIGHGVRVSEGGCGLSEREDKQEEKRPIYLETCLIEALERFLNACGRALELRGIERAYGHKPVAALRSDSCCILSSWLVRLFCCFFSLLL